MKRYYKELILLTLLISNLVVWLSVYERRPSDILSVYFLDVGQGDAILIDSPQHGRVLIDGGKNRGVVSELGKILPFSDRRIDIILATHPDLDHIGGLPEVVSRFDVSTFIEPGVPSNNSVYGELFKRLEEKEIQKLIATRGMVINFGDGVKLVVLYPTLGEDVTLLDPNDASIVAKLMYGEHSFLLTGDAGLRTENILINLDRDNLKTDVLKAGHHGSRTSTSLSFAEVTSSTYTIISAGKNNSYGHPHQDVLNNLALVGTQILNTFDEGVIRFETDGETLRVK